MASKPTNPLTHRGKADSETLKGEIIRNVNRNLTRGGINKRNWEKASEQWQTNSAASKMLPR